MDKYICTVCGYVYDPELGDPDAGVKPGTSFDDLPEDCDVYVLRKKKLVSVTPISLDLTSRVDFGILDKQLRN